MLKPGDANAVIQSGFLQITIARTSYQMVYAPSPEHSSMYQQASHLRALLQRPEVYGALKILPEQARKLRALSHLPNRPNVVNGTMLYMIYRESPAGTARQDAADDLCDAVRSASQNHHAVAAEFVRAAGKILTGIQLDALPGVVDVPIQPGPISNENKKEGIRQ